MKIPARPIVVVVCVVIVAVAAWAAFGRARAVVTPTGGQAGRIIGGVSADSLNVIVLTLDTTRWDRLGAYGDVNCVDAEPRSARLGRRALRGSDRAGPPHAAVALDAVHRPAAAAPRRARQRRLRARSQALDAGRTPEARRLADRAPSSGRSSSTPSGD